MKGCIYIYITQQYERALNKHQQKILVYACPLKVTTLDPPQALYDMVTMSEMIITDDYCGFNPVFVCLSQTVVMCK